MSSIPYVTAALRSVLTDTANAAARSTHFIQRQRVLTGASFVQSLVFGFLANPHASLDDLAQVTASAGTPVSPQALDQRFTPQAAACLQTVLAAAAQHMIAADPVAVPLLNRFSGVFVLDSTIIMLPDALAHLWRGTGSAVGTIASLKVQVVWDLTHGTLQHINLHAGRANDHGSDAQSVPLPVGSLRIADLGYFSLPQMARLSTQGSFVLSRYQPRVSMFDLHGKALDLRHELKAAGDVMDRWVVLGKEEQLKIRLLGVRVPQEVADQRRRRIRKECRDDGRTPSELVLALAAWTVMVTSVPQEQMSVEEALVLLRARWQIELLFKLWKSGGVVDEWRTQQPWRILCEVYAKLLAMVVQHWVLLVGCWNHANRSLVKAAKTVRDFARVLMRALKRSAERLEEELDEIRTCLGSAGRMNTRKQKPNLYQLLLAMPDGTLT